MKKVLVLEDSRKVGFGGGQKGSLEVLEALTKDFEVIATDSVEDSIFATRSEKILGRPVHPIRSFGSVVGGDKGSFGIGISELALFPFLSLWNLGSLKRLLRREQMNRDNTILYAPLKKTLVLAWVLSAMTGIPYVYHARTVDNRDSRFFKILMAFLKRSSTILCVSKTVANNLNLPQCQLLYNAVPIQTHVAPKQVPNSDETSERKFVVAAFASLFPLKGLQYLVHAARQSRHANRLDVRIYGAGPMEHELSEICPQNCQLHGFADNVNELMATDIHAVCTPSIVEEAFGRVPMEGNSFGIPAIVTDIGAQAEITVNGETGYHVPVRDSQAIADAIDHMIDNPDHYRQLSTNALQYSNGFDLTSHRARVLEIFQTL